MASPEPTGTAAGAAGTKLKIDGLDLDSLKNQLKEERIRLRDFIMQAKEDAEEKELESNHMADDDDDELNKN